MRGKEAKGLEGEKEDEGKGRGHNIHTCFVCPDMVYCSCEMNLYECRGTTLSSWSAVRSSIAGYCTSPLGTDMLCNGENLEQATFRTAKYTHTSLPPPSTCEASGSQVLCQDHHSLCT